VTPTTEGFDQKIENRSRMRFACWASSAKFRSSSEM